MDYIKQHRNQIYLGVTIIAVLLAIVLSLDYKIRRDAEQNETAVTATTIKEKEKKDRVVISVSTDTIQDGLANMGFLITQEYYFTQVEKYTKEKTFLKFITSSSEFMYSYDGAVMAGIDFGKIKIKTDEDRKIIAVEMPDSEIQTWNPLKLEDYNISLVEFENAAKDKAIASGILERSDEQARKLVREFITSLPNTSEYTISFTD